MIYAQPDDDCLWLLVCPTAEQWHFFFVADKF